MAFFVKQECLLIEQNEILGKAIKEFVHPIVFQEAIQGWELLSL